MFKLYLFLSMLFLICNVCALFQVKYRIDSVNSSLSVICDDIYYINEEIDVLEAELSYMSRPCRLEYLAGRYLYILPTQVNQIISDLNNHYILLAED